MDAQLCVSEGSQIGEKVIKKYALGRIPFLCHLLEELVTVTDGAATPTPLLGAAKRRMVNAAVDSTVAAFLSSPDQGWAEFGGDCLYFAPFVLKGWKDVQDPAISGLPFSLFKFKDAQPQADFFHLAVGTHADASCQKPFLFHDVGRPLPIPFVWPGVSATQSISGGHTPRGDWEVSPSPGAIIVKRKQRNNEEQHEGVETMNRTTVTPAEARGLYSDEYPSTLTQVNGRRTMTQYDMQGGTVAKIELRKFGIHEKDHPVVKVPGGVDISVEQDQERVLHDAIKTEFGFDDAKSQRLVSLFLRAAANVQTLRSRVHCF